MNRKIHNNEGKSILMALLLLLVAVVVSVVIVTAAVSSVMQIDDNRKSQQEYLTVSSAAELIRDCLQDVTYTHTEKIYKPQYSWSGTTRTETTQSSTAKYFIEFVNQTSDAILYNTDPAVEIVIPGRKLTVTTDDMDPVTAVAKVIATGDNTYELRIKMETKHTEDSQGYRMRMNLVITKGAPITSNSIVSEGWNRYNVTTTETTVTWGKATISKGWGNEE